MSIARRRLARQAALHAAAVLAALASTAAFGETAPILRSAEVRVSFASPTSCAAEISLAVDQPAEIEHRIETVEGARVELSEVRDALRVGEPRQAGRSRALILRPEADTYALRYTVELPAARAYRCPLWLPTVPADGLARDVRLRVRLPDGATPGGTMPSFAWSGAEGAATLGHLPAFVHVPYATPGAPAPPNVSRLMDIASIATLMGATLVWAYRRPRRGLAP